jgi:hypothetical protein
VAATSAFVGSDLLQPDRQTAAARAKDNFGNVISDFCFPGAKASTMRFLTSRNPRERKSAAEFPQLDFKARIVIVPFRRHTTKLNRRFLSNKNIIQKKVRYEKTNAVPCDYLGCGFAARGRFHAER